MSACFTPAAGWPTVDPVTQFEADCIALLEHARFFRIRKQQSNNTFTADFGQNNITTFFNLYINKGVIRQS
jgi:hypothetical protein